MLLNGPPAVAAVYVFLNSSQEGQRQRDGIVHLAAMTQAAVLPAAPAPGTYKAAQAAAQQELCSDSCFKVGPTGDRSFILQCRKLCWQQWLLVPKELVARHAFVGNTMLVF